MAFVGMPSVFFYLAHSALALGAGGGVDVSSGFSDCRKRLGDGSRLRSPFLFEAVGLSVTGAWGKATTGNMLDIALAECGCHVGGRASRFLPTHALVITGPFPIAAYYLCVRRLPPKPLVPDQAIKPRWQARGFFSCPLLPGITPEK